MQQTIESQKPESKVVKNLYQKLVEIRKNLTYLQKGASGQKGKYVDGATVLSTIRPMIDEAGLLLIPNVLNTEITNVTVVEGSENKEKVKQIIKSDMLYTWINADNPSEKLEVQFACVGMQLDISMAFGSALTYSERYFLLKFFNIPTDKDDPETFENKINKVKKMGVDIDNPDFEILLELKNQKSVSDLSRFRTENIKNVSDRAEFIKAINKQSEVIRNGNI